MALYLNKSLPSHGYRLYIETMEAIGFSLSSLSFVAAVVVCGVLSIRIIVPPNNTPKASAWKSDSIAFYAGNNVFIYGAVAAVSALNLYYAALVVSPPATAAHICPVGAAAEARRDPDLFAWSPTTVVSFLAILVGAPLRLGAFSGLGRNFTFGLAKPSGLVTDGIYRHVQHPSYTGIFLVAVAAAATFFRPDGAAACLIPTGYWPLIDAWLPTAYAGLALLTVLQIYTRVSQEEAMLKELFGKEWIEWNKRTARFIPGIL